MAQNKDLVADAQTLLEENLSEKKSVESGRRLDRHLKRCIRVLLSLLTNKDFYCVILLLCFRYIYIAILLLFQVTLKNLRLFSRRKVLSDHNHRT